MDDIRLTRSLLEQGYNYGDLRRLQRGGELVRVRRGAYARDNEVDQMVEKRHRRLILATAPQLRDGAIFSHGSAAVIHGLPVWPEAVARVHVIRNRRGSGIKRSVVQVHGAPLVPGEIVFIDDLPVTSLARTILDLARTLPMTQAVAAGDRALALGLTRKQLGLELLPWNAGRASMPRAEWLSSSTYAARAPASP